MSALIFHIISFRIANKLSVLVAGVIGGEVGDQYPFFVAVLKPDGSCGGTIVGATFVVTAASCVYRQNKQRWAFSSKIFILQGNFSTPNDDGSSTRYPCEEFKAHYSYDPVFYEGNGPYNIALLKATEKFELLGEAHKSVLRPCTENIGYHGTIIRLGLIHQNPNIQSQQLMEATLQCFENCGEYTEDNSLVNPEVQLC